MQWNRIVHGVSDSVALQARQDSVASRCADHELVVNMPRRRGLAGNTDRGVPRKRLAIESGIIAPPFRPAVKVVQFHAQYGSLNLIQAKVSAHDLAVVLR